MAEIKKQEKKLRIFWNSNSPWTSSGYGQQMAELLPYIVKEGYPTAQCDFYGLEGGKLMINGVLHYPKINHVYGSDALIHHAKDFNADVVFTLQDVWVLNPIDLAEVKYLIPICPIDHAPVAKTILDRLKFAYRVVTYSQFGQEELKRHGIVSTYIPHTVDTEIFKPMDKIERKKAAGIAPDVFLCGMVAANKDNPPRKSFQEVMDAFKMFLEKEPKALLYLHTNPDFPGGFPIKQYAEFIKIADKLLFPDTYQMNFNIDKNQMALIYNAFDVLLSPSFSEGFGVPIIEAESCGIPVIVNNFVSMPELIKPGITGELCEVASKRFSPLGSYVGIPSTKSIFDCLMKIHKADRVKMGKEARKWVVENYDTKDVFNRYWKPYLTILEKELVVV
uniref:Putative glycosyltransferase n=3 Tax=viral metagenome TaxID=1070528 RepID=A0A6M3KW82_9ZZZZ